MSKILKFGDKIKINSGCFKGVVGELMDIEWGFELDKPSMANLKIDNNNIIRIDMDTTELEVIDDFPKRFKMNENNNCIIIRSNVDINGWVNAVKDCKEDINDSVIYIETNNYSKDEEEIVDMVTAISLPQAKYLIKSLNEIVEYIEDRSKMKSMSN